MFFKRVICVPSVKPSSTPRQRSFRLDLEGTEFAISLFQPLKMKYTQWGKVLNKKWLFKLKETNFRPRVSISRGGGKTMVEDESERKMYFQFLGDGEVSQWNHLDFLVEKPSGHGCLGTV